VAGGGPANAAIPGFDDGVRDTRYGPLAPSDVDFLRKVRLAGLWEGPSGRQAQTRSQNQAVREAGQHMVAGHAELDARVVAIGEELEVALPVEPTGEQKGWMAEMTAADSPAEYDRVFIDRLRVAHGKVYGLVAQIRAGTRNSMIRSFSQRTMEIVLDHILMLEKTGMVDWSTVPLPPAPDPNSPPGTNLVQTATGPMTDSGRDFLAKVRLAGLWEGPTGRQAQERAGSAALREAGQHLIDGHAELDKRVVEIAAELEVPLPTEPNADQRAWMAEMTNASSPQEYDRVFVKRLREAHGKVYGLVAQIRAGTHNTVVRAFAQRTMEIVLDHIVMLEKTGLVDFESLPPAPEPESTQVNGRAVSPWLVLTMVVIAAAMTLFARQKFSRIGRTV
jgi:predicted outer membrane protein